VDRAGVLTNEAAYSTNLARSDEVTNKFFLALPTQANRQSLTLTLQITNITQCALSSVDAAVLVHNDLHVSPGREWTLFATNPPFRHFLYQWTDPLIRNGVLSFPSLTFYPQTYTSSAPVSVSVRVGRAIQARIDFFPVFYSATNESFVPYFESVDIGSQVAPNVFSIKLRNTGAQ